MNNNRKLQMIFIALLIFTFAISVVGFYGCGAENIKPVASAKDQLKRAMDLYNKKKYYKAEIEFQKFVYNYPGVGAVDTAQFYLAMSYYKDKDYALAAGEFKRFLSSFPSSEFSDDAQYRLAMSHYHQSPSYPLDQTETYMAINGLISFLDTYPNSGYADSASVHLQELRNKLSHKLFSTGRLYQKMGYYDPAIMYYNKLLEDYPNSPFAEESVFRAGECYLKLEKYIPAREKLLSYVDSYKNGKFHKKAVSLLRKIEDIKKAEN